MIFLLGTVIGAIGIRYDYIKNTYYMLSDIPKIMKHFSYYFDLQSSNFENVSLNFKFKEYQIITDNRDRNIIDGHAVYIKEDWAKGNIIFSDSETKIKAKIRLKGTMSDNWVGTDGRWSFRVNLKGDQRYEGMKEFSLFRPSVASGVLEWLFQTMAYQEGLLSLRTKLVKLSLNGNDLGFYYLQEHYNKALVENNKKREGPIVGYSKDRIVEIWDRARELESDTDGFGTADLKLTGDYAKLKLDQKRLADHALGMLEAFRNHDLSPSEIIDADAMGKLLAMRAIIASSELDWKDIKFYYNPLSSKLEPIVREAHADYDLYDWWYRGTRPYDSIHTGHTTFEDLIFSDEIIYEKYIEYLRRYIDINLVDVVKNNNDGEYNRIISAMSLSNDGQRWLDVLQIRSGKIKAALNHPDPITVSLVDEKNLNIRNFQGFPIVIKNIILNGDLLYKEDFEFVAHGIINEEKYYDSPLNIFLDGGSQDGVLQDDVIEIVYSLYGDDVLKNKDVEMYFLEKISLEESNDYNDLFIKKNGELHNRKKNTIINSTIITPKDIKVIFSPGSVLTFESVGQLISPGGIDFNGSEKKRITVKSSEKAHNGGIFVSESNNTSTIKYTDFYNLKGVFLVDKLITGCVNFYKSSVIIENSTFKNNYNKDDYLNIVNSVFSLKNIFIESSFADSVDIDFSEGLIEGIRIYNSGNDGLDFSGSQISLNDVYINKSNDKAFSVGENSRVKVESVTINNSNIGLAVKDGSLIDARNVSLNSNRIDYVSFIKKEEYSAPELKVIDGSINFNFLLGENSKMTINGNEISKITKNIKELLY